MVLSLCNLVGTSGFGIPVLSSPAAHTSTKSFSNALPRYDRTTGSPQPPSVTGPSTVTASNAVVTWPWLLLPALFLLFAGAAPINCTQDIAAKSASRKTAASLVRLRSPPRRIDVRNGTVPAKSAIQCFRETAYLRHLAVASLLIVVGPTTWKLISRRPIPRVPQFAGRFHPAPVQQNGRCVARRQLLEWTMPISNCPLRSICSPISCGFL